MPYEVEDRAESDSDPYDSELDDDDSSSSSDYSGESSSSSGEGSSSSSSDDEGGSSSSDSGYSSPRDDKKKNKNKKKKKQQEEKKKHHASKKQKKEVIVVDVDEDEETKKKNNNKKSNVLVVKKSPAVQEAEEKLDEEVLAIQAAEEELLAKKKQLQQQQKAKKSPENLAAEFYNTYQIIAEPKEIVPSTEEYQRLFAEENLEELSTLRSYIGFIQEKVAQDPQMGRQFMMFSRIGTEEKFPRLMARDPCLKRCHGKGIATEIIAPICFAYGLIQKQTEPLPQDFVPAYDWRFLSWRWVRATPEQKEKTGEKFTEDFDKCGKDPYLFLKSLSETKPVQANGGGGAKRKAKEVEITTEEKKKSVIPQWSAEVAEATQAAAAVPKVASKKPIATTAPIYVNGNDEPEKQMDYAAIRRMIHIFAMLHELRMRLLFSGWTPEPSQNLQNASNRSSLAPFVLHLFRKLKQLVEDKRWIRDGTVSRGPRGSTLHVEISRSEVGGKECIDVSSLHPQPNVWSDHQTTHLPAAVSDHVTLTYDIKALDELLSQAEDLITPQSMGDYKRLFTPVYDLYNVSMEQSVAHLQGLCENLPVMLAVLMNQYFPIDQVSPELKKDSITFVDSFKKLFTPTPTPPATKKGKH